ncbi:MAG TPA: methionine--tRNA ligase [Anaeromyxobacteraceae bacterium]|nr:methionine--tRNA ligase [Anaeromyxobacteraceae bacterium]
MSERILLTSALPYANGSIHLGHLVEYIQTDIYARFRRACGDEVTYVCAADSHGTPIEVNAAKAGMSPKEFVEKYRQEQHEDFKQFLVEFSTYYTTDSPENEKWARRIYHALKGKGLIYKKSVEQLYCEVDSRFLPDRFVRGTCPRCGARDQYGDVCERCGSTYDPRELKEPRCAICGSSPVIRSSDHAYVNLRRMEPQVRRWVEAQGHLEPAVREQVKGWLDDLQDWGITRDAPYFGFPVDDPDFAGKFLYVWVDAPIGYLSSAEHHFACEVPGEARLSPQQFEARYLAEGSLARLEHFIGKDILRFHAVFWPAMLVAAGLRTPDRLAVHGHLTVNGEKMSKSRGTFITARTYLDSGLDPQLLRYYYAAMLGPGIGDLDLSLEEFKNRTTADLAKNIGNLASRVFSLVQRAGNRVEGTPDETVLEAARSALHLTRGAYLALEFREAVRLMNEVASLCNKRLQEAKPWEDIASPAAHALLFSIAKAVRALAVMLQPILPRFAPSLTAAFGQPDPSSWPGNLDPFAGPPVVAREKPPQFAPLDAKQVGKLIVAPGQPSETASPNAGARTGEGKLPSRPGGIIQYEDFEKMELRVGEVKSAEKVPGADKLLKLTVDLGEPQARTIVAGIAKAYPEPGAVVGKRVVVVANLAERVLRGITSQGMLLAAGDIPHLALVTVSEGTAPGTRVK